MSDRPILIDNNALVDFFVGEEILKKDAEKLRRKFPFWITSPLCRYEFGNVLRTYVRLGKVSETDGVLMLRQGLKMVSFCSDCAEEVILPRLSKNNSSPGMKFISATLTARPATSQMEKVLIQRFLHLLTANGSRAIRTD